MGWKTLKETFDISGHIVQVTEKGICIGSGFVHDILVVNPDDGTIFENTTFRNFLNEEYPKLSKASPEEILTAIRATDTFSASIPVYTYKGAEIIQKFCEKPGWPNTTHDGCIMYKGYFSTDRDEVVAWAKEKAKSYADNMRERIERTQNELAEMHEKLATYEAAIVSLDAQYPDVARPPAPSM